MRDVGRADRGLPPRQRDGAYADRMLLAGARGSAIAICIQSTAPLLKPISRSPTIYLQCRSSGQPVGPMIRASICARRKP